MRRLRLPRHSEYTSQTARDEQSQFENSTGHWFSQCPPLVTTVMRDFNLTLEFIMSVRLANLRRQAATMQRFRCFYCNLPMWERDSSSLAEAFSLSTRQLRLLQCTAEHLHPRSEGGRDSTQNIVAACHFCNRGRHARKTPMQPEQYRARVRSRMARGQWLAAMLPSGIASHPSSSAYPSPSRESEA
jgi:HNH endonuclease